MVTRAVVVFQMVDLLTRFPCSVLISLQLVFSLSSSSDIVLGQRIRLREKNQSALTDLFHTLMSASFPMKGFLSK